MGSVPFFVHLRTCCDIINNWNRNGRKEIADKLINQLGTEPCVRQIPAPDMERSRNKPEILREIAPRGALPSGAGNDTVFGYVKWALTILQMQGVCAFGLWLRGSIAPVLTSE